DRHTPFGGQRERFRNLIRAAGVQSAANVRGGDQRHQLGVEAGPLPEVRVEVDLHDGPSAVFVGRVEAWRGPTGRLRAPSGLVAKPPRPDLQMVTPAGRTPAPRPRRPARPRTRP